MSEDELDDFSQPSTPPKKRRATGDSDYYNVVCRDTSPTTVIPLSDLPARVAQWLENPRHFSKERSVRPNSKHWFTTSFLQPLAYLVTPQGPENCQLTSSFFVGAQTVVSLLQTTQIISDVCFITDHVAYASSNKTKIV